MDEENKRSDEVNSISSTLQEQQEDYDVAEENIDLAVEEPQQAIVQPWNIVVRNKAGHKRTSSGTIKDVTPSSQVHSLSKGSQSMISITEDYHAASPANVCDHNHSLDHSNNTIADQARQEAKVVGNVETSTESSSKPDLKATRKPRKHKRLISQLPWKDESRFDPEIR